MSVLSIRLLLLDLYFIAKLIGAQDARLLRDEWDR
jgi:hypothetical protein